jgi:hypothetical protein
MKSLIFTELACHTQSAARRPAHAEADTAPCLTPGIYSLRLQDIGRLATTCLTNCEHDLGTLQGDHAALAILHSKLVSREPEWDLITCSEQLAVNGLPCLPLVALEPGDLLAIGERFWLISSLWQPEAVEAPAELRDKPCPVCGGELGLAPVVQCGCGRWAHLEKPSAPDDQDALNCYLAAGRCGGCGRVASLEPQIFPEVSHQLAGGTADADDDELELW